MCNFGILLIAILHFVNNECDCKKYNNYTLFRAVPLNQSHLDFFLSLNEIYDMNFWKQPGSLHKPVDLAISPADKASFVSSADRHGIYLTTLIDDIQKIFDAQSIRHYSRKHMDSFNWKSYYSTEDIYEWLSDLSKAYPTELELKSIGQTFEGRHIMSAKIVLRGSQRRSKVIVEGGIHAREWISPAFVTYFLHQILNAPASNNDILKTVALTYEWYFVPVLNPDGYEYSIKEDRLWRKNRRDDLGVDLNRNFGIEFGSVGVSHNVESDTYCGPRAFSEKESQAMRSLVEAQGDRIEYYIAVHSYGQFMIIPYAYTTEHLSNYNEVKVMCDHAVVRIAKLFDTQYTSGNSFETVGYQTSGVSADWAKKKYNIPYVVVLELRDKGYFGFALPEDLIDDTCNETMRGVLSLLTPRSKIYSQIKPRDIEMMSQIGNYVSLNLFLVIFDVLLLVIILI